MRGCALRGGRGGVPHHNPIKVGLTGALGGGTPELYGIIIEIDSKTIGGKLEE